MEQHLQNPVMATMDLAGLATIAGYWLGAFEHNVAIIATALTAAWYAYCIFEAVERRFRK